MDRGTFDQAWHGVVGPISAGNKSALNGGYEGKANAQQIPNSRGLLKGAPLLCDRCKNHDRGKQNTHTRVGAPASLSTHTPNNVVTGEGVELTKPYHSRQAMPHGRFDQTKMPQNVNFMPRTKNVNDFHFERLR
ncbi:unnamed protein product [Linum trigynum]|uniref:Uncharacterized protein n=1 Tax=Linum trigynum TaxID=586398 RepID=A0AAV2E9I7_9ROSI